MENILPQKLFVNLEDDGDDGFFPIANTEIDGIKNGTVVGIYELKDTKTVRVTTTLDLV